MNPAPPCPVCAKAEPTRFLRRARVPVHQNLLYTTQESARAAATGVLDLHVCGGCGFVFNAAFDPKLMRYGAAYENAQEHSPVFAAHVSSLAKHLLEDCGVRDMHVVEVGCGQGSFLRRLVEPAEYGNTGTGFDPSYTGPLSDLDGRLEFRQVYFGSGAMGRHADAVVSRHVIEHVGDPVGMLRSIRAGLDGGRRTRLFFETPCVEWILRNRAHWDFFYEHCSLFSFGSLSRAFVEAGFGVVGIRRVFGEQYLWLAGAKGCTLASLIDPDACLIDCLIDINPQKQGAYVAATGHPILSAPQARGRGVTHAVLMNPNYADECRSLLTSARVDIEITDIA